MPLHRRCYFDGAPEEEIAAEEEEVIHERAYGPRRKSWLRWVITIVVVLIVLWILWAIWQKAMNGGAAGGGGAAPWRQSMSQGGFGGGQYGQQGPYSPYGPYGSPLAGSNGAYNAYTNTNTNANVYQPPLQQQQQRPWSKYSPAWNGNSLTNQYPKPLGPNASGGNGTQSGMQTPQGQYPGATTSSYGQQQQYPVGSQQQQYPAGGGGLGAAAAGALGTLGLGSLWPQQQQPGQLAHGRVQGRGQGQGQSAYSCSSDDCPPGQQCADCPPQQQCSGGMCSPMPGYSTPSS